MSDNYGVCHVAETHAVRLYGWTCRDARRASPGISAESKLYGAIHRIPVCRCLTGQFVETGHATSRIKGIIFETRRATSQVKWNRETLRHRYDDG